MKKSVFLGIAILSAANSFAGGYLTNTNLSAAFLRNPSRDAVIAIDGLYTNPAGISFLDNGFHIQFNAQNALQSRIVNSTFKPFAFGLNNGGSMTKVFVGDAYAPIIPSLHAAYVWDKWSANLSFGITGGGGKCTFDDGLGSFESIASLLPVLGSSIGISGYDLDSYMRGRQYYFGVQLGGNYKVNDNLSVFGGMRLVYATTNYYGHIKDITIADAAGNKALANQYFGGLRDQAIAGIGRCLAEAERYGKEGNAEMAAQYQAMAAELQGQAVQMGTLAVATSDVSLNCDQSGFGVTPIIGIDWKINDHINIAAKYEFKTRMRLKNKSANSESAENLAALDQFKDGNSIAEDIPAILSAGVQYTPVEPVRLSAGFHYYFDKQATHYGDTHKLLKGNSWELSAGAEYDFHKNWTVSAGWQTTNYGNSDAYMKDLSFTTNSNSIGAGISWKVSDKVTLDAGYFVTLYNHYEKDTDNYNNLGSMMETLVGAEKAEVLKVSGVLSGKEDFWRKNRVIGIGVTVKL